MKKLIVIFFLLFVNSTYAQDKSHDILLKVAAAMRSKQSINYDINYAVKGSDVRDTSKYTGQVAMLRDKSDTLYGGMVWIAPIGWALNLEYTPGTLFFYDLKHGYKVFAKLKSIVYYDPHIIKNTRLELRPESMLWKPFLKTDKIEEFTSNYYVTSTFKDTVINKHSCYSIKIKPSTEWIAKWGNTEWYHIWYINKQDLMLVAWEQWVLNGDKWQYENFHIKSYTFNKVTKDRFSANQLPADYKRSEIKPD